MSNESKEENPYIFQKSNSESRVQPRALLDRASLVEKDVERAMSSMAEDERFNTILYREHLGMARARLERRDARMRVIALFVGGILFGASTVGICVIGPTATTLTLPLAATLGCFAVSLGLILMGSIKSL